MLTVTKRFTFSAAHQLPLHDGPCKNLHGHNYALEVTISGARIDDLDSPKNGMVMDFHDLDEIVKQEILSVCDHTGSLNDLIGRGATERGGTNLVGPHGHPVPSLEDITGSSETTAEVLGEWMYARLAARIRRERARRGIRIDMDLMLSQVRLWETENCCVTFG